MSATRPRLIFESTDGITVLEGQPGCTEIELLGSFFGTDGGDVLARVFGEPPYRIVVEAVSAAEPMMAAVDVPRRMAVDD